jgi:hypothetical protein
MNQAHFQMLDMTIPSGRYNYHDEGYVASIPEAVGKLYTGTREEPPTVPKGATGFYAGLGLDVHIFYLQKPTLPLDIQNRAHEETHAADYIGGLDFVSDKMLEQQVRINLKEIDDEEVRAQLGSLYALHKRGFFTRQLGKYRADVRLAKAIKIWKQSEFPKRKWFQLSRAV